MKRTEKFITLIVLIALVSVWLLGRQQLVAAAGRVAPAAPAARSTTPTKPSTAGTK